MLEKNIRIIDYVTFSDENKWIDLLDATPPNKKGFALIHILPKLSEEKRLKIIKDQSLSIDSLIELGESQKINESLKMFENWLLLLEQLELSVDLFSKIIDNGFLYKADNIKALTKNINFDTFFKNEEFITKLLQQYTSKDEVNVDEYAKTLDYLNSKLLDKSKSIGRIIRMHKTMLGTKRSLKKFTSIMLGD